MTGPEETDDQVRGAAGSKWVSYGVRAGWANGIRPRTLTGNPGRPREPSARAPVLVIGPFGDVNDSELTDRIYPPETESNRQHPIRVLLDLFHGGELRSRLEAVLT